jgi:hypothetical protein
VSAGTTYYYHVLAKSSSGIDGAWSDSVSATVPGDEEGNWQEISLLELGITDSLSADDLVIYLSGDNAYGLADLISEGGELHVNGNELFDGSTMIDPSDKVAILIPPGFDL